MSDEAARYTQQEKMDRHKDDLLLKKLIKRIRKTQHKKSRRFLFVGLWEKIKGLFVSYPTYNVYTLRKYVNWSFPVKAPDNNAFVSLWTLDLLLEAFEEDPHYLEEFQLEDAVKALMEFHDRTRDPDDPLFLFWKQHELGGKWVAFPSNLMPFYQLFMWTHGIQEKLKKLFRKSTPPGEEGGPSHPSHEPRRSSAAISLPADFDDSSLNWILGSSLAGLRDTFPEAWSIWSDNAFDFRKLARHAVECSYRPFSFDKNANAIDPRTFYAVREFLWDVQAQGRGTPEFSLMTTWASTLEGNLEGMQRYYKMPFNVNNIDYSVSANFMYSAMKSVFAGTFPNGVEGFSELLRDTAGFLAWGITSGAIVKNPDLLLLYYPSPYLAFFFVSRTVYLLAQPLPPSPRADTLREVEEILSPPVRPEITEYLLSSARQDEEYVSWDGTSLEPDIRFTLRAPNTHDDRKFITALSVNTLINLWAVRRGDVLQWSDGVPDEVPRIVEKGMRWLRDYGLDRGYPDHNAFFSSSVKYFNSVPFLFPANMIEHTEGPILPTRLGDEEEAAREKHSIFALSGVPSREEYDRALDEKGLRAPDPAEFKKCYELTFPYWSAPSVNYAMICLSVMKGSALGL